MRQPTSKLVHLSQWFHRIFEPEWQSLEALLTRDQEDSSTLNFGNSYISSPIFVKRGVLVDLGLRLGNQSVVLVAIALNNSQVMSILIQLLPSSGEVYLPSNIKLIILSELGVVIQEIRAGHRDRFIEIEQFRGQLGEKFSIEVAIDRISATQNFAI